MNDTPGDTMPSPDTTRKTAYLKAAELALFELAHARILKDTGIDLSESELLNACLRCYSTYLASIAPPLKHDELYRENSHEFLAVAEGQTPYGKRATDKAGTADAANAGVKLLYDQVKAERKLREDAAAKAGPTLGRPRNSARR